jgi:hypothetical protein
MCIYRSQKSAWEDSLLKHTHPVLLTTTTPSLAKLDYAKISLTGVGKKKNLKGAGSAFAVSTVLRHVRNERELLEENGGLTANGGEDDGDGEDVEQDEEKAEEMERERRKKRRTERDGDMVLGFDFEKPKPPKLLPASTIERQKQNGSGGKKVNGGGKGGGGGEQKKGQIKGGGISFKGDREKRPMSKAGWWEED